MLYREGEIHYFKMKGNNVKERIAVLNLIPGTRAVKAGKKSLILESLILESFISESLRINKAQ